MVGRVGWVVGTVAVGTGLAVAADALVGPVDGRPAVHLLVLLALPFWDRLPGRLPARVAVLAGIGLAVAGCWFGLAALRPEPWWRAAVSFGLACAVVGLAHAVLARRTVDP